MNLKGSEKSGPRSLPYMVIASAAAIFMIAAVSAQIVFGNLILTAGFAVLSLCGTCFMVYAWQVTINSINSISASIESGRRPERSSATAGLIQAIENISKGQADAEQLKQQNSTLSLNLKMLQRQKQHIEKVVYSIRDAVIVMDSKDRLIIANAAAENLLGFQMPDKDFVAIDQLIGKCDFVNLLVRARQNCQEHVKHEIEIEADAQIKTFDCIVSCVKDESSSVTGVVAVLHDITHQKEISRVKNDFVSHVSHELKTPLASINAYAEMLVDGEAQDEEMINQFCSVIQTQAQRLTRLIEDMLNISRIESGLTKIDKQKMSLTVLIRQATEMIESYAGEKNITINPPASIVFDQVYGDKDMLSQVIVNLLSNAVKYTNQGGQITIQTEVNEIDRIATVSVSDTGVGIPPEDVEHVFDKFYRVDANKKVAKGTGLGLNLVKQIVENMHDGRVFVTSTVNQGSIFGFELPLASLEAASVA